MAAWAALALESLDFGIRQLLASCLHSAAFELVARLLKAAGTL
jgi:hypothetical protein